MSAREHERHRPRAVVFEDDAAVARLLTLLLVGEGYEVVTASSEDSVLALAYADSPTVVLIDLELPDARGEDLLDKLSSMPFPPDALIVSAASRAALVAARYSVPLLSKPFRLKELTETIARARAPVSVRI